MSCCVFTTDGARGDLFGCAYSSTCTYFSTCHSVAFRIKYSQRLYLFLKACGLYLFFSIVPVRYRETKASCATGRCHVNPARPAAGFAFAHINFISRSINNKSDDSSGAGRGGIIIINSSNSGRWRWTAATASTESRPPDGRVIPLLIINFISCRSKTKPMIAAVPAKVGLSSSTSIVGGGGGRQQQDSRE